MIDVSVGILTYHSDYKKLIETIDSILMQENIEYEMIISEDSADNAFYDEIKCYLDEKGFFRYKFIYNTENHGTVKNFISVVKNAEGKYIKGISPGDILYNKKVLYEMYMCAEKQNAACVFGEVKCYYNFDGETVIYNRKYPRTVAPYLKNNRRDIVRRILVYGDGICGASTFVRIKDIVEYLKIIENKIVYCEDVTITMMIMERLNVIYFPKYVIRYEYGDGMSTGIFKGKVSPVSKDMLEFTEIVYNKYPEYSKYVEKKKRLGQIALQDFSKIKRVSKEFICSPAYIWHRIMIHTVYKWGLCDGRKKRLE